MAILKCKMCGGDLEITPGTSVAECEYCGTRQTVPTVQDENLKNLFNRANTLRIKSEFDKAEKLYEKIIQADDKQAEAYWGLILCKYGIEYVDDPKSFQKIPTCHRASFDSIVADEDYKSALACADPEQRAIYEAQAREIDRIQKEILALAQKEETYDVFICYKETDAQGNRTPDSVVANDIYYQLTQEGIKVFYAAITLEGKLGSAYEPIIFAALNSAKVMLVVGTKPEYFTAVWVKNEWSRYLKLIKKDRSRLLIPCYRDMDAYELPEEFAHLQAQDMAKIGFINDIVRGIRKVLGRDTVAAVAPVVVEAVAAAPATAALLDRAFLFLEDGDWTTANEYCEKVLDSDPRNAQAYLGKLLIDLRVSTPEALADQEQPFDDNSNFQKALRFGDEALQATLNGYIQKIKDRNAEKKLMASFAAALALMEQGRYEEAIPAFEALNGYKDSADKAAQCRTAIADGQYDAAMAVFTGAGNENEWLKAAALFEAMDGYRDSAQKAAQSRENAETARKNLILASAKAKMTGSKIKNYNEAIALLASIPGWQNADALKEECGQKIIALKEAAEAARLEAERQAEIRRQEAEKRKEQARKIARVAMPVLAIAIALIMLVYWVIVPLVSYNMALDQMKKGQYQDAISGFTALDGWWDSEQKIEDCNLLIVKDNMYYNAVAVMNNGELARARQMFLNLGDHRDSAQLAAQCRTLIDQGIKYERACALQEEGKYGAAITLFTELGDYKDSADRLAQCQEIINEGKYNTALALMEQEKYEEAIAAFEALNGYSDSTEKIAECQQLIKNAAKYQEALALMKAGKYAEAITAFEMIADYKDSKAKSKQCLRELEKIDAAAAAEVARKAKYNAGVALMEQGKYEQAIETFKALNGYKDSTAKITACENAIKDAKYDAAVALMNQGKYEQAITAFQALNGYKDSTAKITACENAIKDQIYKEAVALMNAGKYAEALVKFQSISGYKDSAAKVNECSAQISAEDQYQKAVALMNQGKYEQAITAFQAINGYKDSNTRITECENAIKENKYNAAVALMNQGEYEQAITAFQALSGYKDSVAKITACENAIKDAKYDAAVALMNQGKYEQAITAFQALSGYKDSTSKITQCENAMSAAYSAAVALEQQGKTAQAAIAFGKLGNYLDAQSRSMALWSEMPNLNTISTCDLCTVAIKTDGTLRCFEYGLGNNGNAVKVSGWENIVSVATFRYEGVCTVGLKTDGTMLMASSGVSPFDISNLQDVVSFDANSKNVVGIKADGTVFDLLNQSTVSGWKNIASVYTYGTDTIGLKTDGTIVTTKSGSVINSWTDLSSICVTDDGGKNVFGVKRDGTVVTTIENNLASSWTNIVQIESNGDYVFGLMADGTIRWAEAQDKIIGVYFYNCRQWKNIVSISHYGTMIIGLNSYGVMVYDHNHKNTFSQLEGWTNIKLP